MKFTTLFGAAALVAALGVTAHAVPTTVASDEFEYEETGPVADITAFTANAKWAVQQGDQSKIVATHFDGGGQALELATDGNLLQFNSLTTAEYEATIEMKVEMVASDTPVDMSTDTTSHAAVYLYKPEGAESGTLKAFGYDAQGETNKWYDLTATGFAIDDKDTANIKIVINYVDETATYTVNETTFGSIMLANPNAWRSSKHLNSVAFQGTGFVDDLFVKQEQVGTYVDFIYEIAQGGATNVENTVTRNIDGAFTVDSGVDAEVGYTPSVALYSRTGGVDTFIADIAIVNDEWEIDESTTQYTDAVDAYVVRLTYTLKKSTVSIYGDATLLDTVEQDWFTAFAYALPQGASYETWSLDGTECGEYPDPIEIASLEADTYTIVLINYTAPASGAQEVADIVTTATLEWTAIDMAAGTVDFSFTPVAGFDATAEIGNMALTVKPTLASAQTFAVPCTNITFSVVSGAGTGTAMIDTANLNVVDQAFLVGLEDYVAPAQEP